MGIHRRSVGTALVTLLGWSYCAHIARAADLFSFGIKGGIPLTSAVVDQSGPDGSYSNSNGYLIGPAVELHLPLGFSIEGDALYRPLDVTISSRTATTASTGHLWEFPVLAKYHFLHTPVIKPYVEAGPSFRTVPSLFGGSMGHAGITAGAGVEVKLFRLRAGPEIRYTHWVGGDLGYPDLRLGQNQAEFLVGISF